MALIAMTVSDTVEYVSDLDPAKGQKSVPLDPKDPSKGEIIKDVVNEGATVFMLRPLDVFLMGHIYDNASMLSGKQGDDTVGIHTRVNQTNIDAVRHGLAGFKNFAAKNGNQLRFKTQKAVVNGRQYDVVHDDIMNSFGVKLIAELADKIKEISEVSPDEEKNSAGASPQSG
ncbi:hypothetical protein [Sinorhizobium fredii]|uniref:hypothetical protein n=1 Tax=Rhizobium fredii TaxID=380 RepID=UPI0012964CA2|nr:hypothetical protein [Sinorhizobium fredii]MQW94052.1 hypothetical protein [Sinorhizobium fredii]